MGFLATASPLQKQNKGKDQSLTLRMQSSSVLEHSPQPI